MMATEEAWQKCACKYAGMVVTAKKPMAPVEKGLLDPGLPAHGVGDKNKDHLPLHRREAIFQAQGVTLLRKTICDRM